MNSDFVKPLDPNDSQPLYQQLQRAVRDAIENHVLAPDDALPSERQLAEDFAVSRITVRRAIEGLVAEGLLVSRQGSGNFVCSRVEKNFAKLTSFSEDMRARRTVMRETAKSSASWRSEGRASSGPSTRRSMASRTARCSCWYSGRL